ncbi:formin-3 [Tachysurus ichikawai]
MKTAVWLLCLFGLALAVQHENRHDREDRSLSSSSDEGWPLLGWPLLKQLNQDQINQLLESILLALGPSLAPAPTTAPPAGR